MKARALVWILIVIATVNAVSSSYDICGDGVCGTTESSYNCKQDCPSGTADKFCDSRREGACDPDCRGNDPDCKGYKERLPGMGGVIAGSDKNFLLNFAGGVLALIILCVVVFFFIRKVKKQGEEQQYDSQGYQRQNQNYGHNQGYRR